MSSVPYISLSTLQYRHAAGSQLPSLVLESPFHLLRSERALLYRPLPPLLLLPNPLTLTPKPRCHLHSTRQPHHPIHDLDNALECRRHGDGKVSPSFAHKPRHNSPRTHVSLQKPAS